MKDESGTVNSVNKKAGGKRSSASDDPNAQIAMKLRAFYHQVQDEALPQRFLDLLEKLDAVENRVQRAD
ncbi:MAG TPA: NepR family anti-sigma factor [Shinella sp.]|nr:NepR family anti-sigma factor [Shinella sp.]